MSAACAAAACIFPDHKAPAAQVHMVDDCVGPKVAKAVKQLPWGEILLLENTRFHQEEEGNDAEFAKQVCLNSLA